jgi:malate dehydrogenase
MYPDFYNTKINGRSVPEVISHTEWLEKDFITTVQQRGAAIIKARGLSSAASAANAAVNTVYKLTHPTPAGDWFSVGVHSDGSYGIEKGLIFSHPTRSNGSQWEVVQGVPISEFSQSKITATENELKEEKSLVSELLPS